MRASRLLAAWLTCVLAAAPLQAADNDPPKTLLMLDFEIIDHTEDPTAVAPQAERLQLISRQLRQEFIDNRLYTVLDRAPVQQMVDRERARFKLYDCNGCELDIAKALNADRVLTAWVQKVSDLILNINIEIKDASTGSTVLMKSVSIRGNNDRSWTRGVHYMVRSMVEKQEGGR